ncbi:unnamed protein product [Dovyalis caffra]|uniref:Uncharacterized protein n=1 Tax=Dovyalis caffra TaxID=77055 RepID=A0AAV1RDH2_9ROSI|nr:unnamed protein product [Dovyalis caffra]
MDSMASSPAFICSPRTVFQQHYGVSSPDYENGVGNPKTRSQGRFPSGCKPNGQGIRRFDAVPKELWTLLRADCMGLPAPRNLEALSNKSANVVDRNNGRIVATASTVEHSIKNTLECARSCNAKATSVVGEVLALRLKVEGLEEGQGRGIHVDLNKEIEKKDSGRHEGVPGLREEPESMQDVTVHSLAKTCYGSRLGVIPQ